MRVELCGVGAVRGEQSEVVRQYGGVGVRQQVGGEVEGGLHAKVAVLAHFFLLLHQLHNLCGAASRGRRGSSKVLSISGRGDHSSCYGRRRTRCNDCCGWYDGNADLLITAGWQSVEAETDLLRSRRDERCFDVHGWRR